MKAGTSIEVKAVGDLGLKQIVNFNIGKSIIEMIDGKIDIGDIDVSLDGVVEFKKLKNSLNIRRL